MPLGKESLTLLISEYCDKIGVSIDSDKVVYRCFDGIESAGITTPEGRTFIVNHGFMDKEEPEVYESKGYLKD